MKNKETAENFQAKYFTKSLALFKEANQTSKSSSEVFIILADTTIRLCFSSSAIRDKLLPALAHLQVVKDVCGKAEFSFFLWDSHSSGVSMLPPPCERSHFTDRGDIWGFQPTRYRFAFHYGEFSLNLFDNKTKQAIFWVKNPDHLPYWTSAAPLRTIFHWCMEMKGCQLLHAAAIGTDKGAVLLTGTGGSGKSTTALTGLCNAMDFAGDDYVVTRLSPSPSVFTLYSSAKINPDNTSAFPKLKKLIVHNGSGEEKVVFKLFPDLQRQIPKEMPLVGVLAPRINRSTQTTISSPAHRKEIERAASLTTVSQLPYAGKYTYEFITELVRKLPSFYLNLGLDSQDILDVIRDFIQHPEGGLSKTETVAATDTVLPSLTVIIPVFNREKIIAEALDNILSQKYPDVEIIVVNDGSEDNSEEIILGYKDVIRYFGQENCGPSQARNRGIVNNRSEYIAFLDSDDLWPEEMLKYLVESLHTDKDADVVRGYCQLASLDENTGEYEFVGNPCESFPNYITGSVFRKTVFDRVGLFDPDLRFGEDNDWFNRAEEMGIKVKRLSCSSVIVRRHETNMTKGRNLVELNVLRVFKKALDRKRSLDIGKS